MIFLKTISFLVLISSSSIISAQKNEPLIVETKKQKDQKSTSDKTENVRYFQQFGIMSKTHKNFKEKYGVQIVYENCVITPYMAEKAKKNNQEVAQYLTNKYGENWKKDLEITPYGL